MQDIAVPLNSKWTPIGDGAVPTMVRCRCVCGVVQDVNYYNLTKGLSTQCVECASAARKRPDGVSAKWRKRWQSLKLVEAVWPYEAFFAWMEREMSGCLHPKQMVVQRIDPKRPLSPDNAKLVRHHTKKQLEAYEAIARVRNWTQIAVIEWRDTVSNSRFWKAAADAMLPVDAPRPPRKLKELPAAKHKRVRALIAQGTPITRIATLIEEGLTVLKRWCASEGLSVPVGKRGPQTKRRKTKTGP